MCGDDWAGRMMDLGGSGDRMPRSP